MKLKEQIALKMTEARTAYENGEVEKGDELKAEAEKLQAALKGLAAIEGMETEVKTYMRPTLPGAGEGANPNATEGEEEKIDPATKAIYQMRYGEESAAKTAIFTDLVGKNYQQKLWEQDRAFTLFLRGGEAELDREQRALLKTQVFSFEEITDMVKMGHSIAHIKTTMVEAQGSLGGFAVPSTLQSEILRRLPGLTAVRGGGAQVVNLTTGNSTEFLEVTGGNDVYTSGLRGAWGSETQDPTEKNFTLGTKALVANIYTYKVRMSQSLVEDASNLVDLLRDEAMSTLAHDEDNAFVIGDGVGKPMGILPGGLNTLGITEVVTGDASNLTATGIKALKRALPSQYRKQGVWLGNSDTYGDIENMIDGNGNYIFPDLTDEDMLLMRKAFETESMPDVAASAYPLLFGDMRGYTILERSGMTVARYQDSNTGPNEVQFHFRRRVGGRVTKPWLFRVQKVAAS